MIKLGGKQTLVTSVSIIKLQINCKISLKEAVWQLKVKKKNEKKLYMMKRKRFVFWTCGPPKGQKTNPPDKAFTAICKITQTFVMRPPHTLGMS